MPAIARDCFERTGLETKNVANLFDWLGTKANQGFEQYATTFDPKPKLCPRKE
jgi:hypothetical protein